VVARDFVGAISGIFKEVFCFVESDLGWGASGDDELTQVNVLSSLLAFGIPEISDWSPVSSSSIACSIALSLASAIATFLSAARIASSLRDLLVLVRVLALFRLRVSCVCVLSQQGAMSFSNCALSLAVAASANAFILAALLAADARDEPLLDLLR
jgi:hypothetical protein